MELTFNKSYKSIKNLLGTTILPDFTVLTGLNGSGKTHLLESIHGGNIGIDGIAAGNSNHIRLFNWTTLIPQDSGSANAHQILQERNNLWGQLSAQLNLPIRNILDYANKNGLTKQFGEDLKKITSLSKENLEEIIKDSGQATKIYKGLQNVITKQINTVVNHFSGRNKNHKFLINTIKDRLGNSFIAIDEYEFIDLFPISWTPVDLFQQSFARLFAAYEKMRVDNEFKEFLNTSKGQNNKFLTKEEFVTKYGKPPWDFVNEILEKSNLNFRINKPDMYREIPYEPLLFHQVSDAKIKFADLSSGERILLSFALCVYYSIDKRQIVEYPKVLLFDEIDAPLHPSMTKSLIKVISDTLVNEHSIKVILTTHSPTTVALSPDNSIFVIENKPTSHEIINSNKDKALSILTSDTPSLSVSYENRRQVFVESKYDAKIYDYIYRKLKPKLHPEISLNFISTGFDGSGNCEQVKDIVGKLTSFGNKTIYGIIDWDLKNKSNDYVKVLGINQRYSIENYIFDPILLATFLLREKYLNKDFLKLLDHEIYSDIRTFSNPRLQNIADYIVDEIKTQYTISGSNESTICKYVCGGEILLPSWLLHMNGHELEKNIKNVFPHLKRYQGEFCLKKEILHKVIDDLPELLPLDFVSIFQEIQTY